MLPEEAAHLFVSLMPENFAPRRAMFRNITQYPEYQEAKDNYSEYYNNDEMLIRSEAIGKVIANRIVAIHNGTENELEAKYSEAQERQAKRWFNILWDFVLSLFGKASSDPFVKAAKDILTSEVEQLDLEQSVPEIAQPS